MQPSTRLASFAGYRATAIAAASHGNDFSGGYLQTDGKRCLVTERTTTVHELRKIAQTSDYTQRMTDHNQWGVFLAIKL